MGKTAYYKLLMHKMTEAHEHKYYLEAAWFAYAILEDRLVSALRQSAGGVTFTNGKTIKMMGPKINEIDKRKKTDKLLSAYFDDKLIKEISDWKENRNDLMHALAEGSKPIEDVMKAASKQSDEALGLVQRVCNAARLLKENRHRVPIK